MNDKPLRLYAIHNENMALRQASIYCREYGPSTNTIGTTKLWDRNTARVEDMPGLTKDQKYWIRPEQEKGSNNTIACRSTT